MKYTVTRIEKVLKSGTSKSGNAYSLDFTNITVSVPVAEVDAFGFKEVTFQYGKASNFDTIESLRRSLPVQMDITIGVEMDTYGNPKTVITDMKALPASTPQNK
jgi:hypothetical protein